MKHFENALSNSEIEDITRDILQLKNQTAKNIILIGKKLYQVKQALDHGDFLQYLEEKVDYTSRTAQRFIKVYKEFGNATTLSDLEPSKLICLSKINKKDREKFIQDNDINNMSCRQIEQSIKEYKKSCKIDKVTSLKAKATTMEIPVTKNKDDGNISVPNNDISKIYNDTSRMLDEIYLKTGDFYKNIESDLELTDFESLLISRYFNKEISHIQLEQIIRQNKLNIPFIQNEKEYLKFLKSFNINNSYMHLEYNEETDDYYHYYGILEDHELSYSTVVEYSWENNEELRSKYIKKNEFYFEKGGLEISRGYIETTSYICIYINKKLFAHFEDEGKNFEPKIKKLFKTYKLYKKCWMDLVDKYIEQQIKEEQQQKQSSYDRAIENAKFKFINDDETYLLKKYSNSRDYIQIFKGIEVVAEYIFDAEINLYNFDFYNTVCMGDFVRSLVEEAKKKNIVLIHILKFRDVLKVKAKKIRDQYSKEQKAKYNFYDDYDFKSSFGFDSDIKEKSLGIFNEEELEFLKAMLNDKVLWRKFYTKTAIKIHPDRVASRGQEAVKNAENQMKLLNTINDKIQKC
jgi:hypothetical protein